MKYRRCGRSGLVLPPVSLGLWQNFGAGAERENARGIIAAAFDLGITYFDLANNYGPPPGSAETMFGDILASDFAAHRDEIVVATKAGHDMWPGPYGSGGTRKHVLASLDQSLARMRLDYVDIFYSHVPDPDVPLEETLSALVTAFRQGKALYVGISKYSPDATRRCADYLRAEKVDLIVHQPRYSLFDRRPESEGLLDALEACGLGCAVFSPLAQGVLTDRYLNGIPQGSRITHSDTLSRQDIDAGTLSKVSALNEIATARGQSLAQMAISWVLRDPRITTAITGASRAEQLVQTAEASENTAFAAEELARIDAVLAAA